MCKKCVDITSYVTEAQNATQRPPSCSYDRYGNRTCSSPPKVTSQILVLPDGSGIGDTDGLPAGLPATVLRTSSGRFHASLLPAFGESSENLFKSSVLNVSIITLTQDACTWIEPSEGERNGYFECLHPKVNLTVKNWEFFNVAATACSFYACIRDYQGSINEMIFTEHVVRETMIPVPRDQPTPFGKLHLPCVVDGQVYTTSNISSVPKDKHNFTSIIVDNINTTCPTECVYGFDYDYTNSLLDFMGETLNGKCSTSNDVDYGDVELKDWRGLENDYRTLSCDSWSIKSLLNRGNATFESMDTNMQTVANAITSEIRKRDGDQDGIKRNAEGTMFRTTVCTQFQWIWLLFPLILLLSTAFLLCILGYKTLVDREKVPAWKSSLLPLLFMGDRIGGAVAVGDMDDIKKDTKKLTVSLSRNGKGWEFVSS